MKMRSSDHDHSRSQKYGSSAFKWRVDQYHSTNSRWDTQIWNCVISWNFRFLCRYLYKYLHKNRKFHEITQFQICVSQRLFVEWYWSTRHLKAEDPYFWLLEWSWSLDLIFIQFLLHLRSTCFRFYENTKSSSILL